KRRGERIRDSLALGRNLAGETERLEEGDRRVASDNADAVDLAPGDLVPSREAHGVRCEDRGAIDLVGTFEPRRQVNGVAHYRVAEALARADIADQRLAGLQADAGAQLVPAEGAL